MNTKKIAIIGLVAALYTVVSILLAAVSFGNIQIRIAEALTLLPVLSTVGIYGVTLGCFLTNLIGLFMGVNLLGIFDVIFGTLTTLIAGYLTYRFRNLTFKELPLLSASFPVFLNGFVVGLQLTFVLNGSFSWTFFWLMFAQVSIGQFIAIYLFGLPLLSKLRTMKIFEK